MKHYAKPEINTIMFETEDIILLSNNGTGNEDSGSDFDIPEDTSTDYLG